MKLDTSFSTEFIFEVAFALLLKQQFFCVHFIQEAITFFRFRDYLPDVTSVSWPVLVSESLSFTFLIHSNHLPIPAISSLLSSSTIQALGHIPILTSPSFHIPHCKQPLPVRPSGPPHVDYQLSDPGYFVSFHEPVWKTCMDSIQSAFIVCRCS